MRNRKKVASLWAQDPELAFLEVERELKLGRRVRTVANMLEHVLFQVELVVSTDKAKARQYAERCLALARIAAFSPKKPKTNAHRVLAYANAVLGRCLVTANIEELALTLYQEAEQLKAVPADMRGCLTTRKVVALSQLRRFDEALQAADRAIEIYASVDVTNESQFHSLPTALLHRASAGAYGHALGVTTAAYGLGNVLADTRRALELIEEGSPIEKGLIASVVGMFGYLLAVEGFTGVSHGVELSEIDSLRWRLETPEKGSLFDAQLRWVEGLVEILGRGRRIGEQRLMEAREVFINQGLVDEAVTMTVDIQWFQLVSGRPDAAVKECEFIVDSIPLMRFDQEVMENWVAQVTQQSVCDEVVGRVFEEVRGLKGVGLRPSGLGRKVH